MLKGLAEQGLLTEADLFSGLAARLPTLHTPPFEFVVVDEAQDVSVAQLRFLAALGAGRPNSLFFAGDLGQRIFQQPFSRSGAARSRLDRARQAVAKADLQAHDLDEHVEPGHGKVSVGTMHLAKGLEFRAVVVMACDDEVPLEERIESIADDADLEEVYNTERHTLYVACTRARDQRLITSTAPASEFLDDLRG